MDTNTYNSGIIVEYVTDIFYKKNTAKTCLKMQRKKHIQLKRLREKELTAILFISIIVTVILSITSLCALDALTSRRACELVVTATLRLGRRI